MGFDPSDRRVSAGELSMSASFAGTRHSSIIRLIALSVVKSFPATRQMRSRPRLASRRNPDAVIEPSGKANLAAIDSRRGASGAIFP